MITLGAFIVTLGVLIFFHEFGHFLMAKWIGVRVERFSLGFGPRIFGFRRGETEYVVSALPLGGYVKLAGESPEDEVRGEPWEFTSRSVPERMRIVAFGPLMNMVLAWVLVCAVFFIGHRVPRYLSQPPVVAWVEAGSRAEEAGLQVGDVVLEINGKPVGSWEELYTQAASLKEQELVRLTVERAGRRLEVEYIVPTEAEAEDTVSFLGFAHYMPPKVGRLTPGFPAEAAGLQVGDVITHIDGRPISHWLELSKVIHRSGGKELIITVERRGKALDSVKKGGGGSLVSATPCREEDCIRLEFRITPRLQPEGIGLIGIQPPADTVLKRYGAVEALRRGTQETYRLLRLTFSFLVQLVSGAASLKALGGPIAIAQIAGSAAKSSAADLLWFMGFLSLQLGVLNLFPIPVLDGGLLVFLLVEAVLRRPLSLKIRETAQQIGWVLIILLMIFAFYNDIMRLLGGGLG